MAREAGAVREGHQGHLANTSQRKVRRQRKKFEDAREVLVGSTQDEDVGALVGGTLRRLAGRGGQLRSRHCSTMAFVLR